MLTLKFYIYLPCINTQRRVTSPFGNTPGISPLQSEHWTTGHYYKFVKRKSFKGQLYSTNCTLYWKQEVHTWVLLSLSRENIFPVRGSSSCLYVDIISEYQFILKWTEGTYRYKLFYHGKNGVEKATNKSTKFRYLL